MRAVLGTDIPVMDRLDLIRGGLDLLFYSGASRMLSPLCRGVGAILMLHHVRPGGGRRSGFAPNSSLEITPGFLDSTIEHVRTRGYEIISLPEAISVLRSRRKPDRPFIVFAIDDGNRDIFIHAWPIFRRQSCPFTIFVAPAITDGTCEIWWRGLEAVIAGEAHVSATVGGERFELPAVTDAQKMSAWHRLYWPMRCMGEYEQRRFIRTLCRERGIDLDAMCRAEAMNWDELRAIASDPLCSIGAHTINHYALSRLSLDAAEEEIRGSAERIEKELGSHPRVFAYPYGDRSAAGEREFDLVGELGFDAGLTTRRGVIHSTHRDSLMALPRVSLNGLFQNLRYLEVMLSGVAFTATGGFWRARHA